MYVTPDTLFTAGKLKIALDNYDGAHKATVCINLLYCVFVRIVSVTTWFCYKSTPYQSDE